MICKPHWISWSRICQSFEGRYFGRRFSTAIFWDPKFPHLKVQYLGDLIDAGGYISPAYQPPDVGALNIEPINFERSVTGCEFTVITDRNLVSRTARIAKNQASDRTNQTKVAALNLLAFCQAMDIIFDSSISFHELAHSQGNEEAIQELRWFRAADRGKNAGEWIDFALGCNDIEPSLAPAEHEDVSLEKPLRNFQLNYIAMLKAGELIILNEHKPVKQVLALITWCAEHAKIICPAAMLYASIYLSPEGPKKGAFKK